MIAVSYYNMKAHKNKQRDTSHNHTQAHKINANRVTDCHKNANKENQPTDNKVSFADNLLQICNRYRRENSQLKIRNNELENLIKIMKQQEMKDERYGLDDLRKGFSDYQTYKTNLYDEYVTNMKNLYGFVQKLYNFYMAERGQGHTKNYEIKMVMKSISEKGVQNFIGECSQILWGSIKNRQNGDLKMAVQKISSFSKCSEVSKSEQQVLLQKFSQIGLCFQSQITALKSQLEQLRKYISKESHKAILYCKEQLIKVASKKFRTSKADQSDPFKQSRSPKTQIIKYAHRSNSKSKSKMIKNDERCSLQNSIDLCRPPRPPLFKSCNKKRMTQPHLNITQQLSKDFTSKNSSFVCTPSNKRTKQKVESVKKISNKK